MKQLTIISGKGGTGKTVIAASFAALSKGATIADCDVDAPNLHLVLRPKIVRREPFVGSKLAVMDREKCTECGECENRCRYSAIKDLEIDPILCEGCGVCAYVCPEDAISLKEKTSGEAYVSDTDYGPMSHAKLGAGEEASGKLVELVRKNARELTDEKKGIILIDGPPGIGCPVIASLGGADAALIVTEPTMSGHHDLERIAGVAEHFRIKTLVCVNKYDLNEEKADEIQEFCEESGIEFVGKIPYDPAVAEAMAEAKPVVEVQCQASKAIVRLWEEVKKRLALE